MVNQAAGNMNQQANLVSIAVGVGPADAVFVSMEDVALSEIVVGNDFSGVDPTVPHDAEIVNSFVNFVGVGLVNQTEGEANIAVQNFVMTFQRISAP